MSKQEDKVSTETPAATTIQVGTKAEKMQFTFPRRYTEGHVLTEIEARQLDRTRAENIANNVRKIVQESLTGAEGAMSDEEITAYVLDYADSYEFSMASAGGRSALTPVQKAARKLARDAIIAKLKSEKGLTVKSLDEEQKQWFDSYVIKVSKRANIIKLAEARVAEQEKAAAGILDGLDI